MKLKFYLTFVFLSVAIACAVVLSGCAKVEFNPETGAVKYSRWGDQHLQGFEVKTTKDGFKVKLDSQQSEAQALTEAIKVIGSFTAVAP